MKKRAICLFLVALLAFGCITGCKNSPTESSIDSTTQEETLDYKEGEYLIKNGESDYQIIFPTVTDAVLEFASAEITQFLDEATGCEYVVQSDDGCHYDENAKYISVGKTKLLEEAGIEISADELETSGYIVKTVGKSIFIAGNGSMGSLCGVYQFLEDLFDFRVYASDEIYYQKSSTVKLPLFDVKYCPTIDMRIAPNGMLSTNSALAYRLKMISWDSQFLQIKAQNMATTAALLPPSEYLEGHKASDYPNNWYIDDAGTDICFSNQDLWLQIVENLKPYILANPTYTKVMLGQEDNKWWCSCDRCKDLIAQYGTNVATAILMANYVETEINKWLSDIGDSRTMMCGVFAYQYTKEPPVSYDKATDTYTANIKANKNVFIMYAPIEMSREIPITHVDNKSFAEMVRGWNVVTENLYVWGYSTNFANYIVDCANWEGTFYNYSFYEQNGVDFLFDQGQTGAEQRNSSSWIDLRNYLQAELSFNCSLNMNDLIDDWFEHYFKGAKEPMYAYYTEMRDLEIYNLEFKGYQPSNSTVKNAKYWPRATLIRWEGYIDAAYKAIEELQASDPILYEKLYHRINKESIAIRYLLIELYSGMYAEEELLERKLSFKEDTLAYGIALYAEAQRMIDLYETWGV